jgi:hypothetical protein
MVGREVDRESVFDLPGRDKCRMVITKGPLTVTEQEKAGFRVSLESSQYFAFLSKYKSDLIRGACGFPAVWTLFCILELRAEVIVLLEGAV